MSVILKQKNTINSILDMEGINDQEQRAIWYGYVGNVTAYNLQYQEDAKIDFDWESKVDFEMTEEVALTELKSLKYNIYTNDGNCFVQQKWIDLIEGVIKRLDDKKKMGWLDIEKISDNQVLLTQMAINKKLLS